MSEKSRWWAIIIPGISFGIIIRAAQFASDRFLFFTGLVSMRSTVVPVMVFIVTPLLLVMTGVVSEIIRNRHQVTRWTPFISPAAGFLAMSIAVLLFRRVSSVNQYIPANAPGILPRLSCVAGDLVMWAPALPGISTLFSVFSLAGGYAMHKKLVRDEQRPVT